MATLTCLTEDCPAFHVPIEISATQTDLETGQPITITAVWCGACSQPLTEYVEPDPDEEPEDPAP